MLDTEINGASERPDWSAYCHRISPQSIRLCVTDTSSLFSCSESRSFNFFKQTIASSEWSSYFKALCSRKDKQITGKLDGSICAFFKPLCASFQTGFKMSTSYSFLSVCFYYFQLNVQSLLWLWLWKPLQAVVTAVSTEPLKYYSWLLAGLLGSGRFRFECQDSLCSIGSPTYA